MNSKAQSKILMDNAIFLILLVIFIIPIALFIYNQMSGASIWADYYAKETTKLINLAKPGDIITLDIHKATEIAKKNELQSFSEIFSFDNVNNEVCLKLSRGRKTCYKHFNKVDILNPEIKLGVPGNILTFEISEKLKQQTTNTENE